MGDAKAAVLLLDGVDAAYFLIADTAHDSDRLRQYLLKRKTVPVIPNNPTRKRRHPFDERPYRRRNMIERTFCRLKDWRRIATRYDKLATNFKAAILIAAIVIWWAN
ncbi:transposase DDE domain protein (plasmid) [Sinorhizobium sp. RAC02]|nr:transposase DDE domain protein [Sinorhizobium sp. RAC02]